MVHVSNLLHGILRQIPSPDREVGEFPTFPVVVDLRSPGGWSVRLVRARPGPALALQLVDVFLNCRSFDDGIDRLAAGISRYAAQPAFQVLAIEWLRGGFAGKNGGSGGARTRNLCRDRAAL